MFNIGDTIIYSAHGVCKINDICDKTVSGITKKYYVMHPIENNHQLTISIPVDSDKVKILDLIHEEEAIKILESFKNPGVPWEDQPGTRLNLYSSIVNTGNRKEIAKVVNTLLRKQMEAELQGKKLYEQDRKILQNAQSILFKEMAIALNKHEEVIKEIVVNFIKGTSRTFLS